MASQGHQVVEALRAMLDVPAGQDWWERLVCLVSALEPPRVRRAAPACRGRTDSMGGAAMKAAKDCKAWWVGLASRELLVTWATRA